MGLATAHSGNVAQDWDLGKLEARLRLELFVMFLTASPEQFLLCGRMHYPAGGVTGIRKCHLVGSM